MLDFGFYNMDCMEGMKEFPDNYFDLAIVDPPYGAGFTEGGGCKGWFAKYHQNPVNSGAGGVLDNPSEAKGGVQPIRSEIRQIQEPESDPVTIRSDYGRKTGITRTGGTWAEKYAKKSLRGMLRRGMNTLKNCSASHGIRLYGVETTLNYHLPDVF